MAQAEERERAAEKRGRQWLDGVELATALLGKAEKRTEWAQAERRAAQTLAAAEQAARRMAEQMLAAEAALADAAVYRAQSNTELAESLHARAPCVCAQVLSASTSPSSCS